MQGTGGLDHKKWTGILNLLFKAFMMTKTSRYFILRIISLSLLVWAFSMNPGNVGANASSSLNEQLIQAARDGDRQTVELLRDKGADPNAGSGFGAPLSNT
jgi:hypothetical protein